MVKLIVGPGNPGAEYAATRHNVGFWLINRLARMDSVILRNEMRSHSYTARTNLWGNEVWLLQPRTLMNRSGLVTVALTRFHKVMPDEILVVHDELDLSPGTVKLRLGGGSGGRNGLKDIAAHLTTQQFWRLHLGIGRPRNPLPPGTIASGQHDIASFMFKAPRKEEQDLIDHATDRGPSTLLELIINNVEKAMTHLHTAH